MEIILINVVFLLHILMGVAALTSGLVPRYVTRHKLTPEQVSAYWNQLSGFVRRLCILSTPRGFAHDYERFLRLVAEGEGHSHKGNLFIGVYILIFVAGVFLVILVQNLGKDFGVVLNGIIMLAIGVGLVAFVIHDTHLKFAQTEQPWQDGSKAL